MNDEFMIGSQLLAAPVVEQGATKRMVYLPAGEWVDYWTKEHIAGGQYIIRDAPLDTCPIYVKAGTILPKYPVEAYIGTKEQKKLILEVYAGDGEYEHYQDDGLDFAYEQGAYNLYCFSHTGNGELEEKLLHEGYPKYEEIEINISLDNRTNIRYDICNCSKEERLVNLWQAVILVHIMYMTMKTNATIVK